MVTYAVRVHVAMVFEHDLKRVDVELLIIDDQDSINSIIEKLDVNVGCVDILDRLSIGIAMNGV